MLSKEEIRIKWIRHTPLKPLDECVDAAMDEYAKQEAIEFAEYINGCGYIEYDGYDRWISPTMSTQVLSTEQLYQQYLNSKT